METRLAARLATGEPPEAKVTVDEPVADEGDAPVGPTEAEEAAYLAEQAAAVGGPATAPASDAEAEEAPAQLPAVEELVSRIPPGAREALDELFRARFVRVQRVPRKALKA